MSKKMNIKKITPQIVAMYLGRKCEFPSNGDIQYGWVGSVNSMDFLTVNWGLMESGKRSFHEVTLHLRSLESITEEEARELYEIANGEKWDTSLDHVFAAPSALGDWWNNFSEYYEDYDAPIMQFPFVFLSLLSKGFDLFGLIDAGLAKEI